MSWRAGIGLTSMVVTFLAILFFFWRVEIPIQTDFYNVGADQTDELIIFLPGIGDDTVVFEQSGFIDLLHDSPRAADSIVVDAHIGYYLTGTLPKRVHDDVLVPFSERGYKKFILVGVSLGGYGVLWLNDTYGEWITGMVLFSPLLGRESTIENIIAAGDISSWRSQLGHDPGFGERVWIWIDKMLDPESAEIASLILAFGRNDKYQKAGELLARSVPDSHVFRSDGGHNWVTWRPLWAKITNTQSWHGLGRSDVEASSVNDSPPPKTEATRL